MVRKQSLKQHRSSPSYCFLIVPSLLKLHIIFEAAQDQILSVCLRPIADASNMAQNAQPPSLNLPSERAQFASQIQWCSDHTSLRTLGRCCASKTASTSVIDLRLHSRFYFGLQDVFGNGSQSHGREYDNANNASVPGVFRRPCQWSREGMVAGAKEDIYIGLRNWKSGFLLLTERNPVTNSLVS
jgi:hypothetical protein